jgi:hypothetical protein
MKQIENWGFYPIVSVMVAGASILIALLEKIEKQILACRFVIEKFKCNLYYSPIVRRLIP